MQDFKTFVDFVLAMENRKEPQALLFLFSILDIKGDGYLDIFTLNYFFKVILFVELRRANKLNSLSGNSRKDKGSNTRTT